MTRNGKIARLPKSIREDINHQLSNGVPGKHIVEWLNRDSKVLPILEAWFMDSPITEQNLSEWKKGGYQDWLRHQESLECAQTWKEQTNELNHVAGGLPISDQLSSTVALALGNLIRQKVTEGLETPEQIQSFAVLMKELAELRKDDHRAVRLSMDYKKWKRDHKPKRKAKLEAKRHAEMWGPIMELYKYNVREDFVRKMIGHLPQDEQNEIRAALKMPPLKPQPSTNPVQSD